jgi:diguanylate cyclase (GGDEF)-like protein
LVTVIGRVALAFIVLAMAKERLELQQRLDALTDALTGLPNRRAFFRRAARRLRAQAETPSTVAVLLFDLDHFKQINDRYGHAIGDRTLKLFAEALADEVRADGVIGRVGGEEFAAFLPNTQLSAAVALAERVRDAFAAAAEAIAGVPVRGTVSVGATAGNASDSSLDVLLGRADMALYAAKKSGRNRAMTLDSLDGDLRPSAPVKRVSRLGPVHSLAPDEVDLEDDRLALERDAVH